MKKIGLFLIISFCVTACSKNDTENSAIVGEWKLITVSGFGFDENGEYEYFEKDTESNITYIFQANGNLIIKDVSANSQTEHTYFFGKDNLAGDFDSGDPKILLVKIDGSKYTYNLNADGIMTLGKSYVDGSDLHFKRK